MPPLRRAPFWKGRLREANADDLRRSSLRLQAGSDKSSRTGIDPASRACSARFRIILAPAHAKLLEFPDHPVDCGRGAPPHAVATENHILAGTAAALGYSHRRDDRPFEAARRVARRTVEIACGSRSRDGISPPAACRPEAVGASKAQAAPCRSPDLRLALSALPFRAPSRGCLQA